MIQLLIPIGVLIGTSLITRNSFISLISALIASCFIQQSHNLLIYKALLAIKGAFLFFFQTITDIDTIIIFSIIVLFGIFIELLKETHLIDTYQKNIKKSVTSSIDLQKKIISLSPFFFIDDYLSGLTFRSTLGSVSKDYKIPDSLFVFLVNNVMTAWPVLIPCSSWGVMLLGELDIICKNTNMCSSSISNLFKMIPFLLYPILILGYSLFIVKKQKWNNKKLDNVTQQSTTKRAHVSFKEKIGIYSPVVFTFFSTITIAISKYSIYKSISETLKHIDLSQNLLFSIGLSIIYCSILHIKKTTTNIKPIYTSIKNGILEMKGILAILALVWTLTLAIKSDGVSLEFIAQHLASCSWLLPGLFFISSILLSTALISAWGSIALNMSLLPFFITCYPNIYTLTGAIVSGAIAGCQLSPAYNELIIALIKPKTKFQELYKVQIKTTLLLSTACFFIYLAIGFLQK